jgi:hypothetical protein
MREDEAGRYRVGWTRLSALAAKAEVGSRGWATPMAGDQRGVCSRPPCPGSSREVTPWSGDGGDW